MAIKHVLRDIQRTFDPFRVADTLKDFMTGDNPDIGRKILEGFKVIGEMNPVKELIIDIILPLV